MALNFDVVSSARRVSHGAGASLNGLAAGGFTLWTVVTRTSDGNNQHILTKDQAIGSNSAWSLLCVNTAGEGAIRSLVWRATATDVRSDPGVLPLNRPTFVAVVFDDAAAQNLRMFTGSMSGQITEVGYAVITEGSGAFTADATAEVYAGNLHRSVAFPFRGGISRASIINRPLSLSELRQLVWDGDLLEARVPGTVLLSEYLGTGPQLDYSGFSNSGTVTEATYAEHMPLRQRDRLPVYLRLPLPDDPVLVADGGTFAISGTAATLTAQRALTAAPGAFSISGTAAAVRKSHSWSVYANPAANPAITTEAAYGADDAGHIAAYERATRAGSDHQYEIYKWNQLNPSAGVYDWDYLDRFVANTGNLPLWLNVAPVDGATRYVPTECVGLAWNHATMIGAIETFAAALGTRYGGTRFQVVALGNEVNKTYFRDNPSEITAYGAFVAAASTALKTALGSGLKVTVCFALDPTMLASSSAEWANYADITSETDIADVTYYPIDANSDVVYPFTVGDDILNWATANSFGPFIVQEYGCPTSTAIGGSVARQAEFIDAAIFVWDAYADSGICLGAKYTWMHDLSEDILDDLGLPPGNFREFYGSIGLRTVEGTRKAGWTTLLGYLGGLSDETLGIGSGTFTITGTAAGLRATRLLSAASGAFAITGTDATLTYEANAAVLTAEAGSYAITGTAAALRATRTIAAASGSFAVSGTAAGLTATRRLSADAGSYTIAGADADLVYAPVGAFVLSANAGAYAITGTAAGLLAARMIAAGAGSFAVSGTAAGLVADRYLEVEPGVFLLTGTAATLVYSAEEPLVVSVLSAQGSYSPTVDLAGSYAPTVGLTGSVN